MTSTPEDHSLSTPATDWLEAPSAERTEPNDDNSIPLENRAELQFHPFPPHKEIPGWPQTPERSLGVGFDNDSQILAPCSGFSIDDGAFSYGLPLSYVPNSMIYDVPGPSCASMDLDSAYNSNFTSPVEHDGLPPTDDSAPLAEVDLSGFLSGDWFDIGLESWPSHLDDAPWSRLLGAPASGHTAYSEPQRQIDPLQDNATVNSRIDFTEVFESYTRDLRPPYHREEMHRFIRSALTQRSRHEIQGEVRRQLVSFASKPRSTPIPHDPLLVLVQYSLEELVQDICRLSTPNTLRGHLVSSENSDRRLLDILAGSTDYRRLIQHLEDSFGLDHNSALSDVRHKLMKLTTTVSADGTEQYEAKFDLEWDLHAFMQSQFDDQMPPVSSIVVLAGSVEAAQATTCGDYLETVWPDSGKHFVQLLNALGERFASIPDEGHPDSMTRQMLTPRSTTIDEALLVTIQVSQSRYEYSIKSHQRAVGAAKAGIQFAVTSSELVALVELAEQLSWSVCALSAVTTGAPVTYGEPSLEQIESSTASAPTFNVSVTHSTLPDAESSCWTPLFDGAVIARNFPIPHRLGSRRSAAVTANQYALFEQEMPLYEDEGYHERPSMQGLEISLDLLAEIGGVRHAVECDGGLVMKGFSHMFVPVERVGNEVQWHAISSGYCDWRLTYEDALKKCPRRATFADLGFQDLNCTRAILGWCSAASLRLGSDSADYLNIDYSQCEEANAGLRFTGGQLGFQQFGMAALDFRLGAKDGKCHFKRTGTFDRVISAAERTPVVLYDTQDLRAWLVNASDVLLHMIQHRHHLYPYEVGSQKVDLQTKIPAGSSAKKVLLKNRDVRLRDEDGCTFKNEVFTLWSLLELLVDQNVNRERNAQGAQVKTNMRDHLKGFEYRAVVDDRSPFRLKTTELLKSHGGWPSLVHDINALILFADGFGELILPKDEVKQNVCARWQRLPDGHDYMATTMVVVKDLFEAAGCRLNRKYLTPSRLQWHQGDAYLFETCGDRLECKCDRLQQIFSDKSIGTILPPGILLDEGAVIFGQCSPLSRSLHRRPREEREQATSFYSQPNKSLVPIMIPQDANDDTIAPDSAYQSASSANSTPDSISSSTTSCIQETHPKVSAILSMIQEKELGQQSPGDSGLSNSEEVGAHTLKRTWSPVQSLNIEHAQHYSLRQAEAYPIQLKRARNV